MTVIGTVSIPKPAQIGLVVAGAAAVVITGRLLRKHSSGPSERLAAALVDTTLLESARRESHSSPLLALTACAGYIANLIVESAAESGLAKSTSNSTGSSCRVTHPYSGATASVFTQRTRPDETLVFTLEFEGVCSVRGARAVSRIKLAGITPSRNMKDQIQIELGDQITVQIETDITVADFVATGSNRIRGDITLEDNRGNAGRLTVQADGSVTGALRNGFLVLGRFTGSVSGGIQFLSFQSTSNSTSNVPGEASA